MESKELKIYIVDHDYSKQEGGGDVIAFRYIEDACRHTSWLLNSTCSSLGLEKGKTYKIKVEQLLDEYI